MLKWLVVALVLWAAWKLLARPRAAKRPVSLGATMAGRRQAMSLLGVGPAADEQAIRDAHRRKVADAHPDRGGSTELTRELNAARDLLLREAR